MNGVLHGLSAVDAEARTAFCSGCGRRVRVHRTNNRIGWRCAPENKLRAKAWREAHPDQAAATKQAYRDADPEAFLALKRASSTRYSAAHRQEIRDRANAERARLRLEVIAAYGGRCSCPGCHVVHAELLTVDHVEGDAHHRQNRWSTRDIYKQIVKAGFPPDYQLLCGSCNLAKSDKDKCPLAGQEH